MIQRSLTAALVAVLMLPVSTFAANDGVVPEHDQPKGFRPEARIEEKIDAQLPMDLTLRDENEQPISLGEAIGGKPTILVPVYYRCPMLCTKVLNGVLEACWQMPADFSIGGRFNVVTVSMDPLEHGDLAREKKKNYLAEYGRPGAENGWRFLFTRKETPAVLGTRSAILGQIVFLLFSCQVTVFERIHAHGHDVESSADREVRRHLPTRFQDAVEHLSAEHRAAVINRHENRRLSTDRFTQRNGLLILVPKGQIHRELGIDFLLDACFRSEALGLIVLGHDAIVRCKCRNRQHQNRDESRRQTALYHCLPPMGLGGGGLGRGGTTTSDSSAPRPAFALVGKCCELITGLPPCWTGKSCFSSSLLRLIVLSIPSCCALVL